MRKVKMRGKQIISTVLCAGLCTGLLAGCGSAGSSSSKSDAKTDDESIELTVFSQTANWSGDQTGWGATLLKDKFGIELVIIPDSDGTYETRVENGDLGDIVVWGSNGDQYKNAVDLGLLFDWEEDDLLSDYGENINEYVPEAVEANRELNSDGKIYGIGNNVSAEVGDHAQFFYTWDIRWDLYKELGYPAVNNLDDLVTVLKQMQDLEPTNDSGNKTYAVSAWPDWDGNCVMYVKSLASGYYGFDELGMGLYDSQTGEFHGYLEENGPYLNCLKFMNNLYQQGLLDPDSMTQTYDQMIAKVQNGQTLFSIFDYTGSTAYNTVAHEEQDKYMASLVPAKATNIVYDLSQFGESRIWSIGAKSEYPEEAMDLIDWLYSPEGAMTIFYGIKGLMWDYDENGNIYLTELGEQCHKDSTTDLTGVEWTSPDTGNTYTLDGTFNDGMLQMNNTTWSQSATNPEASDGETFHYNSWASEIKEATCNTEQDWREYTGSEINQQYLNSVNFTAIPASNYAESSKNSELDVEWSQVTTTIKNYSWKAIYAGSNDEFDSIVQEMKDQCASYGYEDCVEWSKTEAATRYSLQQ